MAMVSGIDVAEGRPSSDLIEATIVAKGLRTGRRVFVVVGGAVDASGREGGGDASSARHGCDRCCFYVYEAQQERFWCLRDHQDHQGDEVEEDQAQSRSNVAQRSAAFLSSSSGASGSSLRRRHYDASNAHIASTLLSSLPAFNATLAEISTAPVTTGGSGSACNFSDSTVEDLTHLIVPVLNGDRRLVGALELTRPTLPLPHSLDKSVSVLSDYGAQIALALERVRRRQHARRIHTESLQRLEWSRKRGGLLLAVENLWNDCAKEVQALRVFEREAKSMIGMGPDGVCALWIAERGMQKGQQSSGGGGGRSSTRSGRDAEAGGRGAPGRRLWTIPSNNLAQEDGQKSYAMVGVGTLVGQAAAYGETRWSQDRTRVAVVVRRLSGEVAAVVEIKHHRSRDDDAQGSRAERHVSVSTDEDCDDEYGQLRRPPQLLVTKRAMRPEYSSAGKLPAQPSLPPVVLNAEDEAMLKIWARHAAVAISHFESMQGCIRGMSDASDALTLLEKQKARALSRGERNAQRAFRFCRDVFSGCGVFLPRVFGLDWLKDIERVCTRMVASDHACVMLFDATRRKLVGKVKVNVTSGQSQSNGRNANQQRHAESSSHRVREIDLDAHPAPMEAVAFRQHCVLCESLSASSGQWKFMAYNPASLAGAEGKRVGGGHVMCIPLMVGTSKATRIGAAKDADTCSPRSDLGDDHQQDSGSGISPPAPSLPGSTSPECVGVLQLIRMNHAVPFSSAERLTARLLGHVLGMLASNFSENAQVNGGDGNDSAEVAASKARDSPVEAFSKWGGKVAASRAIELAAGRGPMTLRHLVQSRRAVGGGFGGGGGSGSCDDILVGGSQRGRMQTFLNFVAQLNSIAGTGDASAVDTRVRENDPRGTSNHHSTRKQNPTSQDSSDPSQDTSVGRLVRVALQQAKELLLCSGVEIFALSPLPFGGGSDEEEQEGDDELLGSRFGESTRKRKIVCLGSTLSGETRSIDLDSDSPVARTVLYSRPVVSVTKDLFSTPNGNSTNPRLLTTIHPRGSSQQPQNMGSDQVLVSIPCCIEVPGGGSMRVNAETGSSAVAVGAVVFLCDASVQPDAAEISVLTGWAAAVGSGILRCKRARDRGRSRRVLCDRLDVAEAKLGTALADKVASLKNTACSRLFFGVLGMRARAQAARAFHRWQMYDLQNAVNRVGAQLAVVRGGTRGQRQMVSAPPSRNSSSSTEAQLYLLARDLQYTDSLAEVVSIVPHRLSEVFSRVHVATFHLVDSLSARRNSSSTVGSSSKGSHVLITPNSLVPMDGGHGIDARVERMRQCAIDGSRVTGKTGARPWMYEPVVIAATTGFMPSDPSSSVRIDTRGGNSVAGVIEFGFLRSQEQRQLPWLSAAESLVLGEATSLISKALTRLVRKRELQDQAAGAMESVDAMQAECDSLVQAYQYTEKRQVMAQRQLRIATELLAARDLKGLSSAISSKRMADLLGADRATLFFRSLRRIGGSNSSISSSSNSSNNSASASAFSEPSMVNEFVSTTTPARYGADGVSGVAKAARRGDVVTSIGEGGQYCSYLPVRLHSIKVTSPPRKTKSGAKTAKTMVKKSLEVPVVLDICWKKVEETEVLGAEKSDKEDQEEGTSGDVFSEPILESDRASLLRQIYSYIIH